MSWVRKISTTRSTKAVSLIWASTNSTSIEGRDGKVTGLNLVEGKRIPGGFIPTEGTEFESTFPTTGRYRLFLQFKHDGVVHTAAFTKDVA